MGCFSSKQAQGDADGLKKAAQVASVQSAEATHSARAWESEKSQVAPEQAKQPEALTSIPEPSLEVTLTPPAPQEALEVQSNATKPNQPSGEDQAPIADTRDSVTPIEADAQVPDAEGDAKEAEAEAIDIDTILQDLDDEDEEAAEEFQALLESGEHEEPEVPEEPEEPEEPEQPEEPLQEHHSSGLDLEESIFDPALIEGVEEELRKEMNGGGDGPPAVQGIEATEADANQFVQVDDQEDLGDGDVLFDPELLDSLVEELKEHTSGTWMPMVTNGPDAIDPAQVSHKLEELSMAGDVLVRQQDHFSPRTEVLLRLPSVDGVSNPVTRSLFAAEGSRLQPGASSNATLGVTAGVSPSHTQPVQPETSDAQEDVESSAPVTLSAVSGLDMDSEVSHLLTETFPEHHDLGTESSSTAVVTEASVLPGLPSVPKTDDILGAPSSQDDEIQMGRPASPGLQQISDLVTEASAVSGSRPVQPDEVAKNGHDLDATAVQEQGLVPEFHSNQEPSQEGRETILVSAAEISHAAAQTDQNHRGSSDTHPPQEATQIQKSASGVEGVLVAKPTAKGKILEKLQSYKIAVESSQGKKEVASHVRSAAQDDESVISPGVVSRVRETWEKSSTIKDGASSGDAPLVASRSWIAAIDRIGDKPDEAMNQLPEPEEDSRTEDDKEAPSSTEPAEEPEPELAPKPETDPEPEPEPEAEEDPSNVKELTEAGRMAFEAFEKRCPPGGEEAVVLYVTSVRAVRKTFDDCAKLRTILQAFKVCFQERDVSQALYKTEMKELMGRACSAPQLFIRGHYIGDGETAISMHEDHFLEDLLEGIPRLHVLPESKCLLCAGRKLVICKTCSGNHKVLGSDGVTACTSCNEQGLAPCSSCKP